MEQRKQPRPQSNPRVWRRNLIEELEGSNSQELGAESATPTRARTRSEEEERPRPTHHFVSGTLNPTRVIFKPDKSPFCDEILSKKMENL